MPAERERNLQITSRLSATLRDRLDKINGRYNTTDAKNVVSLLEAFADAVEEADAVRFPVVVLMAERQLAAAEPPAGGAGPSPMPDFLAMAARTQAAAEAKRQELLSRRRSKRPRPKPSPG